MSKHSRKLAVLAILLSVAPLTGAQAPALAEPMRHDSDCPYARAAATAAQREAQSGTTVQLSVASVSIFAGAPELIP